MNFTNGYQSYTWQGQRIHVYKSYGKQKIALVSMPNGTVADITKFNIPGKKVIAIMNAHYFDMGKTNIHLGRCQSTTVDETTLGPQDANFKPFNSSGDKGYTDLVILKDGSIKYGDFNSWDYRFPDIILGAAPAGIELNNGKDVDWYSPACGRAKITNANTQSLLLKCADGTFALAVVSGMLSPLACRTFSKAYGCVHQSCYDSGGSSQLIVNGSKKRYTGRKVATCFVIYEDIEEEKPTEPVKPEVPSEFSTRYVKCTKGTLSNGTKYPTRDNNLTSDYKNYLINVGDILQFDDVKNTPSHLEDSFFQIVGGSRPDLIGRWFAYDKDYFD